MEQRDQEWFEQRRGRITGSVAGAFLGLSPFMKKQDAVRAFVRDFHQAQTEFEGNIATDYGSRNETHALLSYIFETDNNVYEVPFIAHEDWLSVSPDGMVGEDGMVELKAPFSKRKDEAPEFKSILKGELPHYYAQVQLQIFVAGRNWCDFYQWAPYGTSCERVYADQDWLDKNLPVLKAIWTEMVTTFKTKKAAKPHLDPLVVFIDDQESQWDINEYESLVEKEKHIKARKADILDRLKARTDGKNAEIHGRKLTKVSKAGNISYSNVVKDLIPADTDLEGYRGKPTEYWQLK